MLIQAVIEHVFALVEMGDGKVVFIVSNCGSVGQSLDKIFQDNTKARSIQPDGTYTFVREGWDAAELDILVWYGGAGRGVPPYQSGTIPTA